MGIVDVTAAVIEKDGNILIAQRKSGSRLECKWEFPGGKMESGETPEQCLKRELLEEFGILAEVKGFIAENTYEYADQTIRLVAYRVTHISGQITLNDHEEVRWVTLEELSGYDLAPADIPILKKLLEHRMA